MIEQKLTNLLKRLDKTFTDYEMDISAEKTKFMTNNASDIKDIYMSMGKTRNF